MSPHTSKVRSHLLIRLTGLMRSMVSAAEKSMRKCSLLVGLVSTATLISTLPTVRWALTILSLVSSHKSFAVMLCAWSASMLIEWLRM